MAEWFWANEWVIDTAVYYASRLAVIIACILWDALKGE